MLGLGLALSGCSFGHSPKLVLVISIDGLKSEDINCKNMSEDKKNAFAILCHEFKSIEGLTAPTTSTAANLAASNALQNQ
jgi:hypothetical protein